MALLEVRNVSKVYPAEGGSVPAVRDVSFSLDPGDFVALVGRSGCGKSTLLNLCGAMDFPTAGEVALDGQVTTELDDNGLTRLRRERVGFIFQSFQLIHTLTVLENVELPLLLARKRGVRETALERLRWVELEEYAARYPHQISGGQQQRVAIARALVHNPRLLLADEPTGNLDSITGEIVLNLLGRTAAQFDIAILMATHSAESTARLDRVIHMRDGLLERVSVPL
jgi:putative ABC transport system ATP-binding protein